MPETTKKMDGNEGKTRRGRPRRDIDPENTAPLFMPDNSVSDVFADTYDNQAKMDGGARPGHDGTVRGGRDLFSLESRMEECAALAKSADSESVRLQALIKYSELERQLRLERGDVDRGAELIAFIELIKAETPGEMAGKL